MLLFIEGGKIRMVYQGNLLSKTLVIGIIFLLTVMSIIPTIASDTVNIEYVNGKSSDDDIDWWPMFRHDLQRSGYSTSNAPDTDNVLWNYTIGFRIFSSPAVVDGRVYIGAYSPSYLFDDVYCLDANTGKIMWSYNTRASVYSSPAVWDGKVYIGSNAKKVFCLDVITGGYIWSYKTRDGEFYSSPAVVEGKLYIGSEDNYVYCLDANTGEYIWSYETGDDVFSSPAVADGRVYIGGWDYNVYCLDASNGDHIWSYTTGFFVDSSPAVADCKVYIGSWDDNVYCLDANTGAKIWSYRLDQVMSSPAIWDEKVYISSFDGVFCLDANNGSKIWKYKTEEWEFVWSSSPSVADGKVYIGTVWDAYFSGNTFYCLDAITGDYIWSYAIDTCSYSSPAVADGKVYIGSDDGNIYAFGELEPDAPSAPEINGPKRGAAGILYNFTFKAESPLGNDLYYWIEWADGSNSGWLGPYDSGIEITESHVWDAKGKYPIQAKVKDTNDSVSSWGILRINIPRNRAKDYPLFQLLFDRFPLLEVFLRAMNLLR